MFNGDTPSEVTLEQTTAQNASTPADQNLTIHFLDVGQGDSILIECNNSTMLIDAGESDQGEIVSDYMQDQGISTLDYIVATHPHADHIGGMSDIINGFQIDHFIDSGYPHTTQTYEDMLTIIDQKDIPFEIAQVGQTIDFDPAVDIEVLNPGTTYSDDLNENSVVLKVNYGDTSFLLMGDAGLETEENIMKAGYDIESDIIKVGHHGSQSGSGETFISTVSPEVGIIEVGAENDYGHPDPEILERLQTASKVYRTDLDGTVTITTDGSTYTVTTQKSDTPFVSPNPTLTETSEVIPTESSTSEPAKAQVTAPDSKTPDITTSSESNSLYISDLYVGAPHQTANQEYVKITNKGTTSVNLKGWKIEDKDAKHTYSFPSSYTLKSKNTVTLYSGKGTNTANTLYWGRSENAHVWNNDGDIAYLYDNAGELVFMLER
ncbi:MBL fold metallo-hydrolase [Methanosarcina sp. MSH10X1]|nr:MBL fold metallo-hydrolase [Methanosarcina sp. MSH10X1]